MTDNAAELMLFDCVPRATLKLTGADRAKFLHNFCTNNIKLLSPGQGCEAFVTNIKGRVLAHIFVFAAADALWIDTVPACADRLAAHLDRYVITEDVQIVPATDGWRPLLFFGSGVSAFLQQNFGAGFDRPGNHRTVDVHGIACQLRRIDWMNTAGAELLAPVDGFETVRQSAAAAGASAQTFEMWESLRIAAGFPEYGRDISEEQLAQEIGRTKVAISFTKGCYLGQEPIARIDALGHVNRELRIIRLATHLLPEPGTPLVDPATGAEIGSITSSARDASGTGVIALGYLRSQFVKPGASVKAQSGELLIAGTVAWPEHLL